MTLPKRLAIAGVVVLIGIFAGLSVLGALASRRANSVGPLKIDVPEGWRIADSTNKSMKITNGTIAESTSTTPGTAKAVFDIYVPSAQTLASFLAYLRREHVAAERTTLSIGGYPGVRLSYVSETFAGRQEAVFVPDRDTFILYRAAYPNDDAAFFAGRNAFRSAIESIRFDPDGTS